MLLLKPIKEFFLAYGALPATPGVTWFVDPLL